MKHTSQWINEAIGRMCIADVNNDGYPDVMYNNTLYYPNSDYELFHTYVMMNNQDGTFRDPVNYYSGVCSAISCVADLNGDGWKDIVTLNYDFYNPPPDTCSITILFGDGTGRFIDDFPADPFWYRTAELGGDAIYAFASKDDGRYFAGTAFGVCISTDNGNSWTSRLAPLIVSALVVDAGGFVYAGTSSGIYCSTNNGINWLKADSTSKWVVALTVDNNGNIIAGFRNGGISISSDGGQSWKSKNNELTQLGMYSLAADAINGILFAGTRNGIFRSTDRGETWTPASHGLQDSTATCIVVNDKGVVRCGTQKGIYSSTNNGNDWITAGLQETGITSIAIAVNGDLFASTFKKGIFHSTDNGATWIQINSGLLYPSINCIKFDHEGYLLAGGMGSEFYRSIISITSVGSISIPAPRKFILHQNYPNPFNPTTTLAFDLSEPSQVTLTVFDYIGRDVATVSNGYRAAGHFEITFDASKMGSGVYFYKIQAGKYTAVKKMLLLK